MSPARCRTLLVLACLLLSSRAEEHTALQAVHLRARLDALKRWSVEAAAARGDQPDAADAAPRLEEPAREAVASDNLASATAIPSASFSADVAPVLPAPALPSPPATVVPDARPAVGDEEDAQRRNSSLTRWGVELVVLVTWHSADLEPLLLLFPLERVSFVVYLKGNLRSCEALPADVLRRLAACVPEPNAGGREAHTIAAFVARHYAELPRLLLCMQDDEIRTGPKRAERLAPLVEMKRQFGDAGDAQSWQRWVRSVEEAPFRPDTCMCLQVMEVFPLNYMDMYKRPMQWLLETYLGHDISGWEVLRYANEAMLLAPRAEILRRDRTLYRMLAELSSAVPPEGKEDAAAALSWSYGPGTPAGSLMWAHVLERLWLIIFDADYDPAQRFNMMPVGT